jgi:predicted anti-sigma-YlaC factor YlaD
MECKSIYSQLTGYLDGETDRDLQNKIEMHLKECKQCAEFLIRLKKAYNLVEKEKEVQPDPYMFTRIMAGIEDPNPAIPEKKVKIAFQAIAYAAIIVIGIYSGVLAGKNFSGKSSVSADYQDEIYYLDELQHEKMISVLLSDKNIQQ